jgi:hypothetical protein
VSYQVILEILAIDQAAGFLRDDPAGVVELWESFSWPADRPRPPESLASAGRGQDALKLERLIPAGQKYFDLPAGEPDREADEKRGLSGDADGGNGLRRRDG